MASERTAAYGGLDLGGTKILAVIVDETGEVLARARRATPRLGGPQAVAQQLADTIADAARELEVEPAALRAVGVGAPGAVDTAAGTLAHAANLADWVEPYPLGDALAALVQTRVHMANDVQAAVEAEYLLGAGRRSRSLLAVWWGTGVGGGLVLGGEHWLGRGAAGEIGHTVVRAGGARCTCGRRGCLEAYAGRAAMERRARKRVEKGARTLLFELMAERGRDRLTSGIWQRALERNDRLAHRLVDRAVRMLAVGISSAVNLLDVETVVLGGGLGTRLGPRYLDGLQEIMQPHLFVPERPPAVRLSELGDLAAPVGAALLAMPRDARERFRRLPIDRTEAPAHPPEL